MGIVTAAARLAFGTPVELPGPVLEKFPDLRDANYRVGGIPTILAGWALGQSSVAAITLWRTVFLSPGVALEPGLLLHEFRHIQQFQESKTFPIRYLWESLRRGYEANPYEQDARRFSFDQLARTAGTTTDKGEPKW